MRKLYRLKNRLQSLQRASFVYFNRDQSIIINEYPKSGGTWLGQMLGHALDYPFPRNQLCQFRRQIIHCHLFPYLDFSNCIYVIRDPRDVYLSLYHHYFLMGDPGALWIGDILCQELKINDPSNVRKNIGRFIKRMCLNPPYPRFTLKDYLRALKNTSYVATTTYEALRCNTSKELKKLLQSLQVILPKESRIEKSICKFEFKNRKANARGIEQRFLRKGIVGDWRSVYDLDACNITKQYLGDLLIELGYEKDHEW